MTDFRLIVYTTMLAVSAVILAFTTHDYIWLKIVFGVYGALVLFLGIMNLKD